MQFKNIQVTVNGRNIMASDASISEQNSIEPIYFLGYKRGDLYSPSGPLNSQIQINYYVEPANEPNHILINELRNYNASSFPIRVVVGGITGAAYLNSYSLSVEPNELVTASATYSVYTPLSGQLTNQPSATSYNAGRGSGIAHSWLVYPKMASGHLTGSIASLNYSFSPNFQPIYKIGNPNPTEVKFINANEEFSIISEYDNRILYSGQAFTGKYFDIQIIEINPLSGLFTANTSKLYLYPNSGRITSNRINIQENSIIIQESNIIKDY
jgi:hypothetical protein